MGAAVMSSGPELHYHLPPRNAGSFGSSFPGRIAESLTLTWFRFEVSLVWLCLFPVILATPPGDFLSKLSFSALSPIAALAIWLLMKASGWVFYFIPGMGKIWGWG